MNTKRLRREHLRPHISAAGVGIDRFGEPAIDPTENVKALNEAANKRVDDLSILRDIIAELRVRRVEDLVLEKEKRLDQLRRMDAAHTKEVSALHATHNAMLQRITEDAIDRLTARVGPTERAVYESTAKGVGVNAAWAALLGGVSLIATLILIGLFVFSGRPPTIAQQQPQVVYVPAQPGTLIPSQQQQPAR